MAKLIAGVGTSHVPSIGVAFDQNEQEAPEWKPLFDGYKPAKAWLKEAGITDENPLAWSQFTTDLADEARLLMDALGLDK